WTVRRAIRLRRRWATGHRARLRRHERADVLRGVRQKCHETGALQRLGEHALVLRAGAALAARVDLAALADVSADAADVLVVDLLHLLDAERAHAAARPAATNPALATITAVAVPVRRTTIAIAVGRTGTRPAER